MTSVPADPGANGQQSPLAYQAVIQTKDASLGLVLWGAVTSHGIEELCDAVIRIAEAGQQPVDLEITVVGERKDDATRQFTERLAALSRYGVRVRLR